MDKGEKIYKKFIKSYDNCFENIDFLVGWEINVSEN